MGHPRGLVLPALLTALTSLVSGCSSSQDKPAQGSFAIELAASRPAARIQGEGTVSDDPMSHLLAANLTISEIEARRSDGTWVPVEGRFPTVVDVLALANSGGTVTLLADLLPEGQYTALQVRITRVEIALLDGTTVTIAPPGTGWALIIPVDFGVATGQSTRVDLDVRLDLSLKFVSGAFEFEPEIEVEGVEHH